MQMFFFLSALDKCMEAVFEDGEILTIAKKWLEEAHSPTQFQMANAALIVANLARSGMLGARVNLTRLSVRVCTVSVVVEQMCQLLMAESIQLLSFLPQHASFCT